MRKLFRRIILTLIFAQAITAYFAWKLYLTHQDIWRGPALFFQIVATACVVGLMIIYATEDKDHDRN